LQPAHISNGLLTVGVDEATGAISILRSKKLAVNLVDKSAAAGLNEYFYVSGRDPKGAQGSVDLPSFGIITLRAKKID